MLVIVNIYDLKFTKMHLQYVYSCVVVSTCNSYNFCIFSSDYYKEHLRMQQLLIFVEVVM